MKPIRIVGGGLAGLTLGIGLRRYEVPVSIVEAGQYPRHRVCGEFISGQGQQVLVHLGLEEKLREAGLRPATNVRFYLDPAPEVEQTLPQPGWCLSRHILDELLAREFQRLGGELHERERWSEPMCGEGIVRASGRRVQPLVEGWRFFALKAHVRGVELAADLEMHFVPSGYVGICRLAGDVVNVCGLFRSRTVEPDLARRWPEWLHGPSSSSLHRRLAPATFLRESFCSVAAFSLQPQRASAQAECCVGDALTMIPPVTGNGMSMAFESAEIAAPLLAAYSRNDSSWLEVQQQVARECDAAFATRLRWARLLQKGLFHASVRAALGFVVVHPAAWSRGLFANTR